MICLFLQSLEKAKYYTIGCRRLEVQVSTTLEMDQICILCDAIFAPDPVYHSSS